MNNNCHRFFPTLLGTILIFAAQRTLCAQQPPIRQASQRITNLRDAIEQQKKLNRERNQRRQNVIRDVGKGDIATGRSPVIFPARFPSKKDRDPNKPDAKTEAILKALNSPVTTKFEDNTLEDVIGYLGKRYKVDMVLDPLAMRELAVEYDTKVKFNPRGITLRTTLRKVLGELGMTYYVKNGSINITSVERAQAVVSTRVYPLGNLLTSGNFGNRLGNLGLLQNELQKRLAAEQLIRLIVSTVEPDSWAVNGGQGTIVYNPVTNSLVVKQSAEVHLNFGGGKALRP